MLRILFVCASNFARSPVAAALLRKMVQECGLTDSVQTSSAGAFPGIEPRPVERRMRAACEPLGLDLTSHLSHEITASEIRESDYIFALDEDSYWLVRTTAPDFPQHRLKLYLEFSKQMGIRSVPDPVLGHISFEECVTLIVKAAPTILQFIRAENNL